MYIMLVAIEIHILSMRIFMKTWSLLNPRSLSIAVDMIVSPATGAQNDYSNCWVVDQKNNNLNYPGCALHSVT